MAKIQHFSEINTNKMNFDVRSRESKSKKLSWMEKNRFNIKIYIELNKFQKKIMT